MTEAFLLRKRIADLEAQLIEQKGIAASHLKRADEYERHAEYNAEYVEERDKRIAELEVQRDDLAAALTAIRDEAEGKCWDWCNMWFLSVPAEFQVHDMPRFVAREALKRLEGENEQTHGSDHVEDSSR